MPNVPAAESWGTSGPRFICRYVRYIFLYFCTLFTVPQTIQSACWWRATELPFGIKIFRLFLVCVFYPSARWSDAMHLVNSDISYFSHLNFCKCVLVFKSTKWTYAQIARSCVAPTCASAVETARDQLRNRKWILNWSQDFQKSTAVSIGCMLC